MARYLKMQNEIVFEISDEGNLIISELDEHNGHDSILIRADYIKLFVDALNLAIKDGYQGD